MVLNLLKPLPPPPPLVTFIEGAKSGGRRTEVHIPDENVSGKTCRVATVVPRIRESLLPPFFALPSAPSSAPTLHACASTFLPSLPMINVRRRRRNTIRPSPPSPASSLPPHPPNAPGKPINRPPGPAQPCQPALTGDLQNSVQLRSLLSLVHCLWSIEPSWLPE